MVHVQLKLQYVRIGHLSDLNSKQIEGNIG